MRLRRIIRRRRLTHKEKRAAIGRTLICLVLGSGLTVAIAWGCVLWMPLERDYELLSWDDPSRYVVDLYRPEDWSPAYDVLVCRDVGVASFTTVANRPRSYPATVGQVIWREERFIRLPTRDELVEQQSGLAWYTMRSIAETKVVGQRSRPTISFIEQGIKTPAWFQDRSEYKYLPTKPMWPGFLYSTLMYGSAVWVMLWMLGSFRVRWRRSRGLCANCRYDLRGLEGGGEKAVCPECGLAKGEG